jgi:alcohol dehydrogenase class IV
VSIRQKLQIAAFGTLFSMLNFKVGLGLSHSMGIPLLFCLMVGHALGATYAIPHGITSCLTLSPVIAYKARTNPAEANQIARLVPFLGLADAGSDKENALAVAEKVAQLVDELGLKSSLTEYNVPHTKEEMEAIAERAAHAKEGDNFNAVVEIVRDLY